MGLTVGGPPPGAEYTHTPDVLGNAKLADPVRVKLRYPTEAVKRTAGRKFAFTLKLDEDGRPVRKGDDNYVFDVDSAGAEAVHRDLLEAAVVDVENYTDAAERPIKTGYQLWENGPEDVILDVIEEIKSGHAMSEEKKSVSEKRSDSSKAPPPSSSGVADSAEISASISPVVASQAGAARA